MSRSNRAESRRFSQRKIRLVPYQLADGNTGYIDPKKISPGSWTVAHGITLAGTSVNSARFYEAGLSTIIEAGNGHHLSLPTAELELLAVAAATKAGYNVTSKQAT